MSNPVITSSSPALTVRSRLNLNPARWGVQALAEIGVAIALAAVLGQVRLFQMPQGGSVSLELLPIIFIAVRRGVAPAIVTGVLYGLLQLGCRAPSSTIRCRPSSTIRWPSWL